MKSQTPYRVRLLVIVAAIVFLSFRATDAQDLLNDTIEFSGQELDLVPFVKLPENPINAMVSPAHDRRLYVSSTIGRIHVIDQNAIDGPGASTIWFDAAPAIADATNTGGLNFRNQGQGGMRSFAFHPEFNDPENAGSGKFYISAMVDRPADPSSHHYLGSSVNGGVEADSIVMEFTYDFDQEQVDPASYREVFRINIPVLDHPMKQMKFNPYASPDDDDYGLLYITHGDAATQPSTAGGGQRRDNALGKVLRVDPLATDDAPYSTPNSPFASDPETLDEIYALGFRNPHNFSFAENGDGPTKLVVVDIGRANVEEVNIVEAGADHGWSTREGPFVHLQKENGGFGLGAGVGPLPENEAENGLTYPVAMFDHDAPLSLAIAGAHVIDNGSELNGEYIFGDFGSSGRLFHASFDEMLNAITKLDPNDPSRDEPSELTYATTSLLQINFDADSDSSTDPEPFDLFTELLGLNRSDLRFGKGDLGELYISSKQNGTVYLVTNTLPLQGDTNFDGEVSFADFLALSNNFSQSGDWSSGDFDLNGVTEFADFLVLSQNFGVQGAGSQAVPEPSSAMLVVLGVAMTFVASRKNRRR